MPIEITIALGVLIVALIAVIVYAVFFSDEKPEGFQNDVEHDNAGKPLPQVSVQYEATVVAEGLLSRPAAWLRKLFGKSTP